MLPTLGFVGFRGAGKTTLLTRLLPLLHDRGLRAGVVKQAHTTFEIDHPGKDSFELRRAGAAQMLVVSRRRWALMVETPGVTADPALRVLLGHLDQTRLDLILVEGFTHQEFAKVEVHRPALGRPLLIGTDPNIVALATDGAVSQGVALPILDLNNPARVAEFIVEDFLRGRCSSSL